MSRDSRKFRVFFIDACKFFPITFEMTSLNTIQL